MPITFQCSQCGKRFRVKDELAGRKARCKCGREIAIPSPATEPQPKPQRPKPQAQPQRTPQPKPQPKPQKPKPQTQPQRKPQPRPQPALEELELEVLPEPEPEPASSGLAGLMEEELLAGESLAPTAPALPAQPAQPPQQPTGPPLRPQYPTRPNYPPYSEEPGGYRPASGSRRAALQGPREADSMFYLRMAVSIGGAVFGLIAGVLYASQFFRVLRMGKYLRGSGFEGGGFLQMWAYAYPFLLMLGCFGLVAVGIAIMLRVAGATQFGFLAGGAVVGVLLSHLVIILIVIFWVKIKFDVPGFPTAEYFEECAKALGISIVPGVVVWWCGSPMGQDLGR